MAIPMQWIKSHLIKPFVALMVSIALFLISFVGLRIAIVRPERIGHLVGEIDIYLRKRALGRAPKRIIIITGEPCNLEVVKLFRKYVTIVSNVALYRLLNLTTQYPRFNANLYSIYMATREYEIYEQCPAVVSLDQDELRHGYEEIEKKFGINSDDWWVCFHSRDGEYLKKDPSRDYSYHDFRDFDIEDMVEAMETVTTKGGYAIRFGSSPDKPLLTDNPKIIDYSFNGRTDFLDIFLCAKAYFFIGSTSGPFHLPKLFDTPYAMCNLIGYGHLSPLPQTLFIPKKIKGPDGRIMTFDECNKMGMFDEICSGLFYRSDTYVKKNLSIVNNSPLEIKCLVDDMFDLVEGEKTTPEISGIQQAFKDNYFSYSPDRHCAGNISPSFVTMNPILFRVQ